MSGVDNLSNGDVDWAATETATLRARLTATQAERDRLAAENAGLREALEEIEEIAGAGAEPGSNPRTAISAYSGALNWIETKAEKVLTAFSGSTP